MARLIIGANFSIGDYDNGDLIVKQSEKDNSKKGDVKTAPIFIKADKEGSKE